MWSYQHEHFTVHQLPALKDNYIYLIEARESSALIAVDPAEAISVRQACKLIGKPLTHVINTHHHWDHTDGNSELKEHFACKVIGAAGDAHRIPAIDTLVSETTAPEIHDLNINVLELPGHTSGHIAYLIDDALFCGDVLFGAGCGRLFEGTHIQMWQSLCKIAALDEATKIYCAHEYTLTNLRFARTVDPENDALHERTHTATQCQMEQRPTIPSTLQMEKMTNPFLRVLDESFGSSYARANNIDQDHLTLFTDLRVRRDRY